MKRTVVLMIVFMISLTPFVWAHEGDHSEPEAEAEESIGTVAGTSTREMEKSMDESYEVANKEAEEALAEIKESSEDALQVFLAEAEKMLLDLQVTAQKLVEALNREMEKFKKSYFAET